MLVLTTVSHLMLGRCGSCEEALKRRLSGASHRLDTLRQCARKGLERLHVDLQILWTFSIYLEAVAILPQLVMLQRTQNIDNLTGNYVFLLG